MRKIIQRANERGTADYGWLKANYSFSFANYYNPQHVNFGALRVLNDDIIAGGMGFGEHPHDNMEIISIPLKGALKHKDSMGEKWIKLTSDEVQVMSAGTGVVHSERNNSTSEEVNLFQIWIIPEEQNVEPTYGQKKFMADERQNKLQTLVSSYTDTNEHSLKIHQDAKISRIDLETNKDFSYALKTKYHGVYVMVVEGEIEIDGETLLKRDAIGIHQTEEFSLKTNQKTALVFIEVPMKF
jgi:redox-sensitive bicupin YhaK (pirin superfamily)